MSLRFVTPQRLEPLVPRLSSFVASYARHRIIESPEARLREVIPLYILAPGGAAIEASGKWYLRVSLEAAGARRLVGIVASFRIGRWRIESLEERDELEETLAWLDQNAAEIDSTVGYFRDRDTRVATLYLVDADLHRVVESPMAVLEGELLGTDRVIEVVRRLAALEPRIIELPDIE